MEMMFLITCVTILLVFYMLLSNDDRHERLTQQEDNRLKIAIMNHEFGLAQLKYDAKNPISQD